jgi:RluA family pseudouridine synthase
MPVITNISTYKFAPLTDLKSLRERLIEKCRGWGLKGTILLSTEGINLFVAGPAEMFDLLMAELHAVPGLEGLTPKVSLSDDQPFNRMLVRIKKEIISFGVEGIDPANYTSKKLPARELKQWLDEGRPITLLDTRNDYEVKLGTFQNAIIPHIDSFRQFPDAVRKLPEELKDQPVVMFCTGGIRCEKAGPFMEQMGFRNILQLEGGILKYFEEVGGDHYDGECFVFDQRVGVDPGLRETESTQCYHCQSPLTDEEQSDPRYVPSVSCPYCFKDTAEIMAENIARRHNQIKKATTPLPGSLPYDNFRPVTVSTSYDGATLLDFLCGILSQLPREEWLERCKHGRLLTDAGQPVDPDRIVRSGERYLHLRPATVEPDVNADIRLLHEDEAIIVLLKPAPLPMHPCGRFNRNTLQFILNTVYHPQKPRHAHRLDAGTTGLIVCARTKHFAGLLQPQFAKGTVEKVYLVQVQGHPKDDSFVCEGSVSSAPSDGGVREIDEEEGRQSRTEFRVLHRKADGTALLEARPITGRTNQIRLHLCELGFPVVGDQIYREGKLASDTVTNDVDAAPLCLHAWKLAFDHPLTKERMHFETELPLWAAEPS